MTGWLIFAMFAMLILGLLCWPVRLGKAGLMLIAASLFAAAAGYAWQGSAGLPGAPALGRAQVQQRDAIFVSERMRFLNHYGETGIVLGTADALHRWGEDEAAASLLRNTIAKHPADVDLRIGYAHALLLLAQSNMTPAVQLAFDRADQIAKPDDPRPAYFRGLALLESGDPAGAERRWRSLYAGLSPGSPWAIPLSRRLAPFDAIHRMEADRSNHNGS